MKWTNHINLTKYYKWLNILLVVLLVDNVVNGAGIIGRAPFGWYYHTLISMLAAGLLIATGKHLTKLKGNRKLTIACSLMGVIFLLGSIYDVIQLISNYWRAFIS